MGARAGWPRGAAQPIAAWVAVLLQLVVLIVCAGITPARARGLEHMEHRGWVAADGGPSQVGAIAQTRDGYLWLGTNDSLYRFDGLRFSRFEPPGQDALGIVSALLAVDDELWVGLRAGGATRISGGRMRHYGPDAQLPGGSIYGFARDRDHALWAAANDGLARFDGTTWQRVSTDWNFPGRNARAVFVDHEGVVWAANEKGLFYLPRGAHRFIDAGVDVDWASQIAQAPDGALWVTERYAGALHRIVMAGGKASAVVSPLDAAASGLLFDRDGGLWISTLGSGVLHAASPSASNPIDGLTPMTVKDGLSADYLWPLLEDNEGNVWAGSSAGLDRFRPRALMPSPIPNGVLNVALVAGSDGSLWAGTLNRAAMRLVDGHIESLATPAPVTSAMRDLDGVVWMAGPSGIWHSRGGQMEKMMALPASATAESSVRAMARDAHGDLWVSINRLGLFVWHDGAWSMMPPPSSLPSQVMPVTAAADAQGRLWFGYRDNLLVTRDAAGERQWGAAQGLQIGHVTTLFPDGPRTWIGGQHGAGFIEADRFHALRLPANGLFDNIYAMIPVPVRDGAGGGQDLWIHAKSGIFQVPAAELARSLADPGHELRYRSYDQSGGLANDPYQVLPLPTAARTADGRLWFSTSSGVVWIDPHRRATDDAAPKVMIESLSADGAGVPLGAPATLAPGARRVVVDYTALSLSSPESMMFRYRLDGYDSSWQDAGRQRSAIYTGLDAGQYRFRVLAIGKDGLPSAQEAQVAFVIPPVFYRRPLFLLLVGLLACGALWLFYRIKLQRSAEQLRARLEERHGERERIARELHDTLLQGVQGLMLRFQAVAQTIPPSEPARRSLEQALDRADELLDEGRDRVRDLRNRAVGIDDLAEELVGIGRESETDDGARFSLNRLGSAVALHPIVRDEAFRIGFEAIVNAYAHAEARRVHVELLYAPKGFRLRVVDDGRGIEAGYLTPEGRPDHWGLRGMHERARRIGGTLQVTSAAGEGTEIRLDVRAALAYRRRPRRAAYDRLFGKDEDPA